MPERKKPSDPDLSPEKVTGLEGVLHAPESKPLQKPPKKMPTFGPGGEGGNAGGGNSGGGTTGDGPGKKKKPITDTTRRR